MNEKLYVRNYDDDGGKPKEELVTTHEDIEDEGQTVFLCEKPEEEPEPEGPGKIGKLELTTDDTYDEHEQANVPRTGDDSILYIQFYLGMMLISLAGLLAILFRFDIRKK